jgi:hypothetical protein
MLQEDKCDDALVLVRTNNKLRGPVPFLGMNRMEKRIEVF